MASEPGAAAFAWVVWSAMLVAAIACIMLYGRNIPLAEDWLFVPPLTGNEPDLIGWLWAQNNEHRTPLHRLVLLLLLKASGGDFRIGMVANVLLLGALSGALMQAARHLRGGHASYADAFFPVALLHLGNWPNLVWGWQLQFVLSTAVHLILLLLIATRPGMLDLRRAALAGACVVALPLVGASSLVFVPIFVPWLVWQGALNWPGPGASLSARATSLVLFVCAAAAALLVAVYFVGYERAYWNPPSPGIVATLKTSAWFLSLALGPIARTLRQPAVLLVLALAVTGAGMLLSGAWRNRAAERIRAVGLILFGGAVLSLALAVGWGRAGLVVGEGGRLNVAGMPTRYTLLAVPGLCLIFYAAQLYGGRLWRRALPLALCVLMMVLLPINSYLGLRWGGWYADGMAAVERDIEAGLDAAALANRHREFLLHWDQAKLEAGIRSLQAAGIGPFARIGGQASDRAPSDQ